MINKTWQGYEISKQRKGSRFPVYVKSVYKGEVKWTTDYAHAKHYTEATAKKLDEQIDEDIRAGKLTDADILPDDETQPDWQKVLEKRISELEDKKRATKEMLKMAVEDFKKWVNSASDLEIAFNVEFNAQRIGECEKDYTTTVHELAKANNELFDYMATMGLLG